MVMGVRPWLVLLQGEVSAFLLYPGFHLCFLLISVHMVNSQLWLLLRLPQSIGLF